ncbi:hypothetical protein L596_007609 [Steinernema carpocapsae]|uniref:Uncharacterized protein n=1 Tax=Steinernema carpocapsae TaxID=34508 RepID=A0A4U5PAG4_STECR|nr:hypothetical protein L596_007609 [Steinernema carpocapsae]
MKTVCKFSDCPPYYKGLATGYLRVVDLMGLMPKEETTLEIFADDSLDIPALSEATEIEPWKVERTSPVLMLK